MTSILKDLYRLKVMQIKEWPNKDIKRRVQLLNSFKINTVLDIGASIGQYGHYMRTFGYKGKIISFEPLREPYKKLQKMSAGDRNWTTVPIALGDTDGEAEINVAGNSYSSSIMEMTTAHTDVAPHAAYVGKEKISISRLDTIFNDYYREEDRVFMKIDTQGFEKNVLEGAERSLEKIIGIQVEMSLVPLYKGGMLMVDMIQYLNQKGFTLFALENGFSNKRSGQVLQADGLFFKTNRQQVDQ